MVQKHLKFFICVGLFIFFFQNHQTDFLHFIKIEMELFVPSVLGVSFENSIIYQYSSKFIFGWRSIWGSSYSVTRSSVSNEEWINILCNIDQSAKNQDHHFSLFSFEVSHAPVASPQSLPSSSLQLLHMPARTKIDFNIPISTFYMTINGVEYMVVPLYCSEHLVGVVFWSRTWYIFSSKIESTNQLIANVKTIRENKIFDDFIKTGGKKPKID